MEEQEQILFYGELPERLIHGVSISNAINISILSEKFQIDIIEEYGTLSFHFFSKLKKTISFLGDCISLISKSFHKKYRFFYLVFSLSLFGGIKTLILVLIFKLFEQNAKVITHIHRGDFIDYTRRNKINSLVAHLVLNLSSTAIFLSHKFVPDNIDNRYNFVIVPNTVKIPLFEESMPHSGKFVFISNYIDSKGILDLLEVFKSLSDRNINLETYGQSLQPEMSLRLRSVSAPNISINGPINDESFKFSVINSARCLILPSSNEGQPLILLEAMSVGTIVIATRVGDIPQMLGPHYPFCINANNSQELRDAIIRVNDMSDGEYKLLSAILSERFKQTYSFEKHRAQLLSVFND